MNIIELIVPATKNVGGGAYFEEWFERYWFGDWDLEEAVRVPKSADAEFLMICARRYSLWSVLDHHRSMK